MIFCCFIFYLCTAKTLQISSQYIDWWPLGILATIYMLWREIIFSLHSASCVSLCFQYFFTRSIRHKVVEMFYYDSKGTAWNIFLLFSGWTDCEGRSFWESTFPWFPSLFWIQGFFEAGIARFFELPHPDVDLIPENHFPHSFLHQLLKQVLVPSEKSLCYLKPASHQSWRNGQYQNPNLMDFSWFSQTKTKNMNYKLLNLSDKLLWLSLLSHTLSTGELRSSWKIRFSLDF